MTDPAFAAGNLAIITGAALGIGRALALKCAEIGMNVALLDTDEEGLSEAAAAVGPTAEPIRCDVSDPAALSVARARISSRWGTPPSVLVNNAVTRIGRGLDAPIDDWRVALDVNLWGVVYGVRTFLPDMQAARQPGVIVNVGSKQGITNPPGHPIYNMAKAAVRTYTECLEHELRQDPARQITAHLLVPGWTTTGRNEHKPGAWRPDQVVASLMTAVEAGDFYVICPDDEVAPEEDRARIAWTAGDITEGRPPLSRWHPDWQDAYRTSRQT